jgi:aspartyl aminopeptidase
MAHAEHPSFTDATDAAHVPLLNKGVAVKSGARGNYAIGPSASAWFALVCAEAKVATQRFMYRCDHGAGSSVGPIVSAAVGMEGVDVGAPMLAMHSIRELAGARDLAPTVAAYAAALASERKPTRALED